MPFGYIYTLVDKSGNRVVVPGQITGLRHNEYFYYPDFETCDLYKRYRVIEWRDLQGNLTTQFLECFNIICQQIQ